MPTEATPFAQVVLELATTCTEDPTVELLLGEETATVADAGIAKAKMNIKEERGEIRMFGALGGTVPPLLLGICKTPVFALQI